MVKVKVINSLPVETILVKEGNGGVFRVLETLKTGERYIVSIDRNATYREFVCVESSRGHKITFTSDDCMDIEEVEITGYKKVGNVIELDCKKTPRAGGGINDLVTDAQIGKAVKSVKGFLPWLAHLLGLKKER